MGDTTSWLPKFENVHVQISLGLKYLQSVNSVRVYSHQNPITQLGTKQENGQIDKLDSSYQRLHDY